MSCQDGTRRNGSRPRSPANIISFAREYCGTEHSSMVGRIYVMEPAEYGRWLAEQPAPESIALRGSALFRDARLQRLPRRQCEHPCAASRRYLRKTGAARRRQHRHRGRSISARFHSLAGQTNLAGYEPIMPTLSADRSAKRSSSQIIAYLKSIPAKRQAVTTTKTADRNRDRSLSETDRIMN